MTDHEPRQAISLDWFLHGAHRPSRCCRLLVSSGWDSPSHSGIPLGLKGRSRQGTLLAGYAPRDWALLGPGRLAEMMQLSGQSSNSM